MAPRRKSAPKMRIKPLYAVCHFCDTKTTPDYLNIESIGQFVTDRARLLGRSRSGLCAKHQRRLAVAVKRARHLALLPFSAGV